MNSTPTLRILVVDDERTIANYIAELLSGNGYHVLPLYTPEDALEHSNHFHFDLAIVGIIMPGLNGLELADRLREIIPECRILLMDCKDTVEAAKAHRSDFDYLPMPFEKEELLFWVRQAAIRKEVESVSSPMITNDARRSN